MAPALRMTRYTMRATIFFAIVLEVDRGALFDSHHRRLLSPSGLLLFVSFSPSTRGFLLVPGCLAVWATDGLECWSW